MTLGNMRELGVQRLVAYCLNDACRHQGLIDVSKFPHTTLRANDGTSGEVRRARAAY